MPHLSDLEIAEAHFEAFVLESEAKADEAAEEKWLMELTNPQEDPWDLSDEELYVWGPNEHPVTY